ncbi:hypothetical protein HanXRQr2_Chr03g0127331 [Helianthus annuus]|uniref:Uncharacterized protein n=1 Tax=Helianthus annuus TaxID=4232 RepID=A0A9K3JIS5_HELAN|nr:hypothetical protein HanXRQr2_Chr03g0127331 [Helianthus annuus]
MVEVQEVVAVVDMEQGVRMVVGMVAGVGVGVDTVVEAVEEMEEKVDMEVVVEKVVVQVGHMAMVLMVEEVVVGREAVAVVNMEAVDMVVVAEMGPVVVMVAIFHEIRVLSYASCIFIVLKIIGVVESCIFKLCAFELIQTSKR